jgi:hypothetical protein
VLNSDALPYRVAKTVQLCGYFLLSGGSDSSGKRRPLAKSASLPRDPSPTFPTAHPRPLPASSPPPCSFPPPKPAGVVPLAETDGGPALGDGMVAIERAVRDRGSYFGQNLDEVFGVKRFSLASTPFRRPFRNTQAPHCELNRPAAEVAPGPVSSGQSEDE